ncbi:hypothetical protein VTN77DRAFT_169 [Rasamsonia byssochlamydoides]|uniref:uncharacterized protein n=1 Tax=Rasamsonia byssochlamydoides TaxID=89139 RepID=UPI0037445CDA
MALPHSILIVGGGVFGLSTALSLSTRHPNNKITLIEAAATIPNPHGSSVDSSRIVRADYANPAYAKLAAEGIQRWRTTDWGKEGRYTENGLVLVYPSGNTVAEQYTRASYKNVKNIEGDRVEELPTKAAVERVVPRYARGSDIAGGYVNWGSGWADAEAGVRFARKKLEQMGKVTFKTGEVERLIFADEEPQSQSQSQRKVTGVSLTDGTTISADLIILATGAWTPKLVDLRGRAEATGQVLAYIKITDEEQQQLAHMPTILNFATGMFIIPPRNNELKVARHAYGYRNPKIVNVPGEEQKTMEISLPEKDVPIPLEGEEACRNALREMLPELADRPFCRTRICWYTDTPKGDFLITYHPNHPNLFLATGGSGHGYKFFPVLGDKIVDALEGNLEAELQQLWAWPPEETLSSKTVVETNDGSRSGRRGMILVEELARTRKEKL